MIQKLRRQFILVAMGSTLAVLIVIIGALNVLNYHVMTSRKDDILEILSSNNGEFPEAFGQKRNFEDAPPEPPENGFGPGKKQDFRGDLKRKNFSRETAYETRFFSVTLEADGEIQETDLGMIASIEEDKAREYATAILKKYQKNNAVKGFLDEYRYLVTQKDGEYLIVFVDCATDLQNAKNTLLVSIAVSFAGLLAVFALVLFFSKKVFRPVEITYQKQKQFITDASHELKTPLTIISANVEVMEMEAEESQWSKSIKKQIDRMIGLVEQMVTLSRLDEQQETVREKFSLSEAVKDTAELYLPVAESAGKSLEIQVEEGEELQMFGDEKQIRQMVGLLLDNAVKYANSEIRLTLKQKGRKAELRLWNTTEPMEAGNKDILFERFYRPDSSRNSAKGGSGIGLSVVKSIVEVHKGKITAASKDGQSIEFKAMLPLA